VGELDVSETEGGNVEVGEGEDDVDMPATTHSLIHVSKIHGCVSIHGRK
jgi:hypothetical protein